MGSSFIPLKKVAAGLRNKPFCLVLLHTANLESRQMLGATLWFSSVANPPPAVSTPRISQRFSLNAARSFYSTRAKVISISHSQELLHWQEFTLPSISAFLVWEYACKYSKPTVIKPSDTKYTDIYCIPAKSGLCPPKISGRICQTTQNLLSFLIQRKYTTPVLD